MRTILNLLLVVGTGILNLSAQDIPATMRAKLKKDSVEKNDSYYWRINKVKTVTEEGEDEKVVQEIDKYGNVTSYIRWYKEKLDYDQAYTYDSFGNPISRISHFYESDDGSLSTLFTSEVTYVIDPSGLTEHAVKEVGKDTYYEHGRKDKEGNSETTYEYDASGKLIKETEIGIVAYCVNGPERSRKTTRSTYTKDGKVSKTEKITQGGCDMNEQEEICINTYDSLGRETRSSATIDGDRDSAIETTYTENGLEESWTFYGEDGEKYMYYEFTYNDNNLKVKSKSNYKGETDRSEYTYEYY